MTIPSPRSTRRARIEIIPLIDIIFFLLATFVMVSLSMVKNNGIPVVLPGSSTGAPADPADFVTIAIAGDGALFLDKQPVTPDGLAETLASLRQATNGEQRVLIAGDEAAQLGPVIRVLDECRRQGLTRVTFQTRPTP